MERASPGIAALFSGLEENGRHSILDLGAAEENNLRLYSRFARRIRFADFLTDPPRGSSLADELRGLRPPPRRSFDLVLVWNLLDLLSAKERKVLMRRLAEVTGTSARLYILVDPSVQDTVNPMRFALLDLDRVCQTATGSSIPAGPQLLPAEVERLVTPFEVFHAFTLRHGLREYVAVRGGSPLVGAYGPSR